MVDAAQALAELQIETNAGGLVLRARAGEPIIILGRNGTGKAALVHRVVSQVYDRAVYMPGSRPNYFDNESLSMTPASRRNLTQHLRGWDSSPDTRWRAISGTSRNEKAIHDLLSVEMQFTVTAVEEIKREGHESAAISRLQSAAAPFDRVNALLAQANLPVRILNVAGEMVCERDGAKYSIAKMSDGERAALVITSEVIAAPNGTVFVIDEPELHLHRAIVVPLLAALMAERPECAFIVSTHELELANSTPSSQILLVRGCYWQNGDALRWDVDLLPVAGDIPESLRVDLLGSRRRLLFIEGTSTSLDQPLYALLYPDVSVRTRESCREVMRAVAGIKGTEDLHHAEAYGLVDSDGMSAETVDKLVADGIYALPIFAVESLYYSNEVLEKVAAQQSKNLGIPVETLTADARTTALASLKLDQVEHLASRLSERQMRDQLLLALPDQHAIARESGGVINISLASPYPAELARLKDFIEKKDVASIIARYPVRESGLLRAIAAALHFRGREDFERAALARIGSDKELKAALRQKLATLSIRIGNVLEPAA